MYGVKFTPVSDNCYSRLSPGDRTGGGGSRSFLIEITKEGKTFISTGTYVEQLSQYNNKLQDAHIRSQCGINRMIIEHDVTLNEKDHVFGKARILLDALRAHAKEPVNV